MLAASLDAWGTTVGGGVAVGAAVAVGVGAAVLLGETLVCTALDGTGEALGAGSSPQAAIIAAPPRRWNSMRRLIRRADGVNAFMAGRMRLIRAEYMPIQSRQHPSAYKSDSGTPCPP
jgi:hypothetical protein